MSASSDPHAGGVRSPVHAPLPAESLVDRRGFLTTAGAATISALLVGACGGGEVATSPGTPGTTPRPPVSGDGNLPAGITRDGNILRINLTVVSALQATNGFTIIPDPPTVVINLGSSGFRAFTARCTHDGCTVGSVSNRRIVCPCHGSAFDADGGDVLVGPATQPLRSFAVNFASSTQILSVTIP
jgi:cytochrome b6-f complex iron-sulfur subunit